ncbi:MAG: hypothetical protein R2695_03235 [Acidimicrobiales bacterium]
MAPPCCSNGPPGAGASWVTTRRREVGLGYGWLQRVVFLASPPDRRRGLRDQADVDPRSSPPWCSSAAAWSRWPCRWPAGRRGSGNAQVVERRSERAAAMTGIDRGEQRFDKDAPEFPGSRPGDGSRRTRRRGGSHRSPPGDLPALLRLPGRGERLFLGAVTDAMLLGHWYLVQPGLARAPIHELVRWTGILWVPETIAMLWPTGMVSVLNGTIDDAYNGLLGWFWVACVVTTIGLVFVTRAALREREYSAVMAATGLMYLAILTAFGQDLVARILLDT